MEINQFADAHIDKTTFGLIQPDNLILDNELLAN